MNEKKHILVVDDDQRIRKLIQKYLRKNNYLVSTASNASEAYKYTTLIDFDLLATDLDLLQNGSAQNVIISASGPMFGAGYTSPLGCDIEPCATLNSLPPIEAPENATACFSWQTTVCKDS